MGSTRTKLRGAIFFVAAATLLLYAGAAPARVQEIFWAATGSTVGYKLYYGIDPTASRGCVTSPLDEIFVYNGTQSTKANSPIVIFNTDLNVPSNPRYSLDLPDDGSDYRYAVTAFNAAGAENSYSEELAEDDPPAPLPCHANAPTATQVVVTLDEFVNLASAQTTTNYSLEPSGGGTPVPPSNAVLDTTTFKNVTVKLAALTEGTEYTLTVDNVTDFFAGNAISNGTISFTCTQNPRIREARDKHEDQMTMPY